MSIQVQGSGGVVVDVNGSTFRAMVVTLRPVEYGLLGSYRVSAISGTIAPGLAAAAEIYQFRWTATPQLALIWGFQIDGLSSDGTPFLANGSSVGMNIARSWTADGSGGTTITPTGNTGKLRTSMGTSLVGSMRIASTAALGAGTKRLLSFSRSFFLQRLFP